MKSLRTLLATAFGAILFGSLAHAQSTNDFQSHQTGNWNSTATWERWNGSTWVTPAPSTPASSSGLITIQSGHNVRVTNAVTVDQVVLASGGAVTINSGITWTIANGVGTDVSVSGTVTNNGTMAVNSGATVHFSHRLFTFTTMRAA